MLKERGGLSNERSDQTNPRRRLDSPQIRHTSGSPRGPIKLAHTNDPSTLAPRPSLLVRRPGGRDGDTARSEPGRLEAVARDR